MSGGIESLTTSSCLLSNPFRSSVVQQGAAQTINFANVPPGLYLVSAQLDDGGTVNANRVRVSVGVNTGTNLVAP